MFYLAESAQGFGPIAIGLALTLIHLVSIPVTNTSVNPARSTGVALFVGEGWAIGQLWLFWVAPVAGAIVGAASGDTSSMNQPNEAPRVSLLLRTATKRSFTVPQ